MLMLKNCAFVPFLTEDFDGACGDVLVKDGMIEKILPCGSEVPEGAEVMDLAGKTLLPGLIDLHFMNDIRVNIRRKTFSPQDMEAFKKLLKVLDNAPAAPGAAGGIVPGMLQPPISRPL